MFRKVSLLLLFLFALSGIFFTGEGRACQDLDLPDFPHESHFVISADTNTESGNDSSESILRHDAGNELTDFPCDCSQCDEKIEEFAHPASIVPIPAPRLKLIRLSLYSDSEPQEFLFAFFRPPQA